MEKFNLEEQYVSNYVKGIEISGIRKFFNKVSGYSGVISLTLGQPDFPVPEKVKAAMIKAIEDNKTTYTSNMGILELREEVSSYLSNLHINYTPEEICITAGGSEAIFDTFTAVLNPGDKILVPTPGYPAYESCAKLLGASSIAYNLNEDFTINIDEIRKVVEKEKPKVIVISFPSNPTGGILTKKDAENLYSIIKDNEILAITDEIYSSLCFDKYYSIAQFKDIKHKVIFISGFSKMFSMTGLRIGYVCAEEQYMKHILKVHQYNMSCAPSISQWAALEGLKNCLEDVKYMKNEFIKRRDYVYERLKSMEFKVNLPKGAFYIFPSIEKFNVKSEEFCEKLLVEAKVAAVPGSAFGTGGEGYFRISYAYSMEQLEEALDRMEKWLKNVRF